MRPGAEVRGLKEVYGVKVAEINTPCIGLRAIRSKLLQMHATKWHKMKTEESEDINHNNYTIMISRRTNNNDSRSNKINKKQ